MSTWEQRMSDRAQARIRAEQERKRAQLEAEWAAEQAELEERYRHVREAGPPGGCHECWQWYPHAYPEPHWWHGKSVQPGPPPPDIEPGSMLLDDPKPGDWCWHACHNGRPVCCIPVAYASA